MSNRGAGQTLLAFGVLLVGAGGCSVDDPFPELHPLTGTVTRDGKPVSGGGMILLPESGPPTGLVVNASVGTDGTFAAQTERTQTSGTLTRPGVPAGIYKVIYHPPGNGSKTGQESQVAERVTVGPQANTAVIVLPPAVLEDPREPGEDADPPAK